MQSEDSDIINGGEISQMAHLDMYAVWPGLEEAPGASLMNSTGRPPSS